MTPKDNYIVGCPGSANCPEEVGPDYDFGSSPILHPIGGGKQILVAGQKSGVVWGLDPDQKGKVVWQTKLGAGSVMGGVQWGPGADGENAYVAISDVAARANAQPGISALKLATGEKVWNTPAPKVTCAPKAGCNPAQSAAVSVIPGAVFSGAVNGHFRAYSTKTGEILWDFDTAQSFDTVNKVPGQGRIDQRRRPCHRERYGVHQFRLRLCRPNARQCPARVFGRREMRFISRGSVCVR